LRKRSGKGKEKEKEKEKEEEKEKDKGKEPTLKSIGLKGRHFVSNSVGIDTIIDFLSVPINPPLKFFSPFLPSASPCLSVFLSSYFINRTYAQTLLVGC
jgi:hypothetical protein